VYRVEGGALEWTFVSPAAVIGPGARTGTYRTTIDRFLTDAVGRSTISFEDYAVAIVDELERLRNIRRRFGLTY
jgi:putative NADH-flavin reductase